MRLSDGVEWALHCVTVLAAVPPDRAVPAAKLAEFHGVPPAYLAKHLQALTRAGVLESIPGPRGGFRLARSLDELTVLDVVQAVDGAESSFRCSEIRRRGPARVQASKYSSLCGIAAVMHEADEAWRASLRSVTLDQLFRRVVPGIHPEAAVKGARWLQATLAGPDAKGRNP